MKVLVIGSGAREHAICWKLRENRSKDLVLCAPGNPGISGCATVRDIAVDDIRSLVSLARSESIDLTIVGPEYPLSLGIVDAFEEAGLAIFGPSRKAAQLESSKSFAKDVMDKAGVPTARFTAVDSLEEALSELGSRNAPIVLKADGLAAGKGVHVCSTDDEAREAARALFEDLGANKVVIEDFLEGVEASFIAATDGERIVPLATSHDYKRIFDGDRGPNTGGMGAVSPTARLGAISDERVCREVIRPVLDEMRRRGAPFSGFIYAGLMISPRGELNVLEFNCRLGDPECQAIVRRMDFDLGELVSALVRGSPLPTIQWKSASSICLVMAAAGYPDAPRKGDPIDGINLAEALPDVVVFHAGTAASGDKLVTSGGRVLSVTAIGESAEAARSMAYRASDMIQFRGRQMRRDVGS